MKVELNLLSTGTCDLVASYFTYNEVVYKRVKVVVYDPQTPSFGSANVASPLPDVTIPLGTTYTPALPNIIPTPPVGTKFQCVIGITAS